MQEIQVTDIQKVLVTAKYKSARGGPAKVDTTNGLPEWSLADPNAAAMTPAADGMSCTFLTLGPQGDFIVHHSADADLGDGVVPVSEDFLLKVVGSAAAKVEFEFGVPEDVPLAIPPALRRPV